MLSSVAGDLLPDLAELILHDHFDTPGRYDTLANEQMTPTVTFRPVSLATRKGEESARLVFADERLVAILVPIGAEGNETKAEGWYLELGFGKCEADGLLFASLSAAETWVQTRLAGDSTKPVRPQPESPDRNVSNRSTGASLRILVVEDDPILAGVLAELLPELGHQVVGNVVSAPEAVAAAEEHRPDLILMDLLLANGTNGIDAAAEIGRLTGIRSLFMTAHGDVQTRARVEQVRAVELLAKPVSANSLKAALDRAAQQL